MRQSVTDSPRTEEPRSGELGFAGVAPIKFMTRIITISLTQSRFW
jgi:hypothetical protein